MPIQIDCNLVNLDAGMEDRVGQFKAVLAAHPSDPDQKDKALKLLERIFKIDSSENSNGAGTEPA